MRTSVSELKAKLGRFMAMARAGKEVVITDRGQPVARLVPYEEEAAGRAISVHRPRAASAPALGRVQVKGVAMRGRGLSTSEMLREDRQR